MQVGNHVITQKSLYIALFVIGESAVRISARAACPLAICLPVVVPSAFLVYCIVREGPGSVSWESTRACITRRESWDPSRPTFPPNLSFPLYGSVVHLTRRAHLRLHLHRLQPMPLIPHARPYLEAVPSQIVIRRTHTPLTPQASPCSTSDPPCPPSSGSSGPRRSSFSATRV
jgi:hypothetical protein